MTLTYSRPRSALTYLKDAAYAVDLILRVLLQAEFATYPVDDAQLVCLPHAVYLASNIVMRLHSAVGTFARKIR